MIPCVALAFGSICCDHTQELLMLGENSRLQAAKTKQVHQDRSGPLGAARKAAHTGDLKEKEVLKKH